MQFKIKHELLTEAFTESVSTLLDELQKEKEKYFMKTQTQM